MNQNIGLEWLFRTVQEPPRLGPRYLRTTTAVRHYGKGIARTIFCKAGRLLC